MISLDKLMEGAATLADGAAKVTGDLVQKGKKQVDQIALENKLAKAQRQLGALVYSLHKNGEKNDALVERYVQAIADVEAEITALSELSVEQPEPQQETATYCPQCGAEVDPGAIFCARCGNKLL
ncbi:zinc ribbon domain-containing protein [uncultured Ruthenibacterium sp.]|uniref:zinc ribbon domain-containing protein n=1 Tax=uncultured Ruthenibacterium sp. TaxID=1905347 RepID=UPI00349E75BE